MTKYILKHDIGDNRICKASIDGVYGEYYPLNLLVYDDDKDEAIMKVSKVFVPKR
jgi:hypothetical protein